jgi:hypothetical protein
MLDAAVLDAVDKGMFHIYTAARAGDGLELLTGQPSGLPCDPLATCYAEHSALDLAQQTLLAYRRACRNASPGARPKRVRH